MKRLKAALNAARPTTRKQQLTDIKWWICIDLAFTLWWSYRFLTAEEGGIGWVVNLLMLVLYVEITWVQIRRYERLYAEENAR